MPHIGRIWPTFSLLLGSFVIASASNEPPNEAAVVSLDQKSGALRISYEGHLLFSGSCALAKPNPEQQYRLFVSQDKGAHGELTQHVVVDAGGAADCHVKGVIEASDESFPAEDADVSSQKTFRMIRNVVGLSDNLRNNAIYDRIRDWELVGQADRAVQIQSFDRGRRGHLFFLTSDGSKIEFIFRPRFYQKHKNLPYFEPWKYDVWKGSVTGWSSWWAYFDSVREQDIERVSKIFGGKLRDFGYKYIQIDDGYQSGNGGLPKDWLNTNKKFPGGLAHLSKTITENGLSPALWANVHFGDADFVKAHPDWFIQDPDGKPHKGPWIDYGLDGSVKGAVDTVVRPTYHALHQQGWKYVKVDALRHLLYDSTYPSRAYFKKKGVVPEEAYRDYLKAIRSEIGPETYMLACWGVLPETIGIANGCRLGGDGFGPSTLQQYTSWNNVVWRNDPDHCDVKPLVDGKYVQGQERIRPVLVSMAGAQLLLSDKPEVYEDDKNLEGVKRSSPIMFTLPGELYDYDPVKTDNLKKGLRNENGGANSGPIDADQRGKVCPWWMLDINLSFESWTVLTRMNWETLPMGQTTVSFADLGLPPATYSVFEFWSKKYLGDFPTGFAAKSLEPNDLATYAIRRTVSHPQILSTSRHISQGGVDLRDVTWDAGSLSLRGTSDVVKNDSYSLYVRLPKGCQVKTASFGRSLAEIRSDDQMAEIKIVPETTKSVPWHIDFTVSPG